MLRTRIAIEDFTRSVAAANDHQDLSGLLQEMTRRMGFTRFALTHHNQAPAIRLSTYPDDWIAYFDRHRFGLSDPIHRASYRTGAGFRWNRISEFIDLTAADEQVFALARRHDLADGFTVPFTIIGEAHGSCSFAVGRGRTIAHDVLPLAQLVGIVAFEGARRIQARRTGRLEHPPQLTVRQRDCLLWTGRGKTAWETSRILGISQETVVQHLKQALGRYGVRKRTILLILALLDGTLSFADIVER
ncbi:MAG: LuxR family transcriptional regulator [Candidatus Sphingomonas phytovorans]|nr:LuxR family transcriptional regulator [Sphingomonas sp.]WEK02182.1 MAG: LuxR family transcriptional regulator [Sphingomonas sp.]